MAGNSLFTWPDVVGWIVLSGGVDSSSEIRAQALERAAVEGAVAYISFAADGGDSLMEDMEDLGAPTGFMLDLVNDDAQVIAERLKEASVIVIEGGASPMKKPPFSDAVLASLLDSLSRGSVLLIEGSPAAWFGRWWIGSGGVLDGFSWISPVCIAPGVHHASESLEIKEFLLEEPQALVVAVAPGSAFVLGPDGRIELWGEKSVSILLGSGYNT